MKRALCLVLAALISVFILAGCDNADPSVKSSSAAASGRSDKPGSGIPDYVDADALAHRSYELRYLLAQQKFDSPDDISASALVQFCFCHLYYDDLTDMPTSGNRIREATVDDIKVQILKYFGSVSTDLTKADLYNRGKGVFEMWEPLYGADIYYEASVAAAGDDTYKVTTVFYNDPAKTERLGKTVLTVEDLEGHVVIRKLTSAK